ncbi:MAG: polysaccharide deacetylase family protein [Burkholderiales bacterium]
MPSRFIRASLWVNGGVVLGTALAPHLWPLALGTLALNHAAIAAAGLWPRSRLLGPNLTRLPAACAQRGEIALTLDDGPDPVVTPMVLKLLDRFTAKATFFCIGSKVRRFPDLCREIVRRGHAVENHTEHHSHRFSFLGPRGYRNEILAAQESIASVTGFYPKYFRAPAGLRNPFLEPVLCALNLRLASWTRRGFDTAARDANLVTRRLVTDLRAGDILLMHDGNAAITRAGNPVILEVLPKLLEAARSEGLKPVTLREAVP